jgi:DNA repair photolyase
VKDFHDPGTGKSMKNWVIIPETKKGSWSTNCEEANTYRGCAHNCGYCNAQYTHEYLCLETGEFAHRILVKDNAAQLLDQEFS